MLFGIDFVWTILMIASSADNLCFYKHGVESFLLHKNLLVATWAAVLSLF